MIGAEVPPVSDPTTPVRRVRRPTLSSPRPPETPPAEEQHEPSAEEEREAIQAEARAAEAEHAAWESRAEPPPGGGVRQEIRREGHAQPIPPGFVPRDGDVLVLSYPEVTLPLPRQFSMMKFGGLIYTRQLRAGDDVEHEARTISAWLERRAETEGVAKYRRLVAEFVKGGKVDARSDG